MKQLVFSLVLLSSVTAAACGDSSVAIRYLTAIDDMNWQQMSDLLADTAHYTDPTMIHYDRPAIDLRGRDAIVNFWKASSEGSGTSDIDYTVRQCLHTAGYYIVNLDIAITVSGEFWNVNKDKILIPGKVVSVIRVADSRVVEHHDFVGYADAEAEVAKLQQEYGIVE